MSRPSAIQRALVLVSVAGLGILSIGVSVADDWPHFRGPNRDGRSPDTDLLESWPESGPPLAWKASGLGTGYSSVSVVAGRVYTMGDIDGKQYVLAVDRETGVAWRTRVGDAWDDRYPGPRSTPTVHGGRVYALSTEGRLVALDADTGEELWRRDLVEAFAGALMKAGGEYDWRFAESPLVHEGRVVVTPGSRDAGLVALDAETGETVWKASLPEIGEKGADGAGYSSPVIARACGRRQIVQFLGRGVVGVDAADGTFLWGYNRIANDVANIATPIVDGERVFVSSGYGTGSALLEIECGEGGEIGVREVYFLEGDALQNHHGGVVVDRGVVFTGTGHNKGFPIAVDLANGEILWGPVRNEGKSSAAIVFADDRLYFRYQDGRVILIDASAESYRERGSFTIPDVERESWPHPVVIGGHLYLREQDDLWVYDVRDPHRANPNPNPNPKPSPKPEAELPSGAEGAP